MKKFPRILAMALVMVALAFGQAHAQAVKQTLVIDLVNEPTSLDPHVQWNPDSYAVYRNVFDNLITRDDEGAIQPQIATAWRTISDTVTEFDIRAGVTFHDGTPLTAEDVVFSVKRITDPAFRSPQLGQFDKIKDAEVVGGNKVRLTTAGPYPVLLAQLVKLSIVPRAVVTRVGAAEFNLKPVGSGPYRFVEWQRGQKVVLQANADYWGDKGGFPTVEFRAVPDAATRVANLRAGRSDLIVTINSDHAAAMKPDNRVKVLSVLTERVAYLRLNTLHGGTRDIKVRRAIAHAIDRQAIVEGLLGGFDKAVDIIATPAHVGWIEGFPGHKFDLALAKRLIAEAGDAGRQEMTLITAPVFDQRIVQAIQQMLVDAGFKVSIALSDMQTYLRRSQAKPEEAGELSFGRWSCACQDLDGVLHPLLMSNSIWSKFADPRADQWLEEARGTLDGAKRQDIYRRVHQLVEDQVPLVPLYQAAILYGARRELDWRPTSNESMFVNRMKWRP
jgi:peptide/nickel transport system substrate-binding protein